MKMFSNIKFMAMALVAVVITACHGYVDPATLPKPDPTPDVGGDDKGELVLSASTNSITANGEDSVTFQVHYTGDDQQGGGDDGELLPVGVVRIYADKTTINADGTDCVNFTVLYGTESGNLDISEGPTTRLVYTFDGKQTELSYGVHQFSTTTPGTYTVKATAYRGGNLTSENEVVIVAKDSNTSGLTFFHKHLGMQFTSVGCQNCPALSTSIKTVQENMPDRLVAVSFHEDFKYEDPMTMAISAKYHSHLGEDGLPRFFLNMRKGDIGKHQTSIERGIEEHTQLYPPTCGVAIESEIVGDNINVKAKIISATNTIYRYEIIVVEDGIVEWQLGEGDDYVHNNVARHVMSGGITGSRFNGGSPLETGLEYIEERTITIDKKWSVENLRIVVVALTTPDGGSTYVANNCNQCKAGESVDFIYADTAAATACATRAEGNDVTTKAVIRCKTTGETISASGFKTSQPGEYEFEATYNGVTSNVVVVTATPDGGDNPTPPTPGESKNFERHIAVMEFTGAWCTWCPDGYNTLKMVLDTFGYEERAHIIALHDNTGGNDPMGLHVTTEINNAYGPLNFPAFLIDMRDAGEIKSTAVRDALKRSDNDYPAVCGVALNSTFDSAAKSCNVDVKVYSNVADSYRVALYLLEDGIIYPQNQGSLVIDNYQHNHVVRQLVSASYKGDRLADFGAGEEHSKSYTFTVPAECVVENCSLCALAIGSNGYVNNMNICALVDGAADYNLAE